MIIPLDPGRARGARAWNIQQQTRLVVYSVSIQSDRPSSRYKAKFIQYTRNDDVRDSVTMTSSFLDDILDALLGVGQHVDSPVERVEDGEGGRKQLPRDLVDPTRLSFPVHGVRSGRAGL